MQILVNTDNQIKGSDEYSNSVKADVESGLSRFGTWLTRVEVHLTVEGHDASQENKRCVIEARPAGMRPVSVSDDAATLEQAVSGAVHKMERLLDSMTAKMRDTERHTPKPADVEDASEVE